MSAEPITFRPAIEADLGMMALVMERANSLRNGLPLPDRVDDSELDNFYARTETDGVWTHAAIVSNGIAGFTLGYPYSDTQEYLSLLMVEPRYWGKGIAGKLLDIAAYRARMNNKEQLLLWTGADDNERARGGYMSVKVTG